ncbi:hypothetical protein N0V84_005303 [Fusarium piperis]|uniref:Uncharacterized protein n=1 Tax=Fusarium piperis TaxID=1435070 RepID=A0A9W8WEB8_9HYPO|nr:hypothetical protein N0V84_005303 [Fusarium piperis]
MAHQSIHNFYRVWFTYVDPLTLIPTVYALLYTPEFMLEGLIPPSMAVYNPMEGFFYHQLSALYAFVGIMLGGVLLRTGDSTRRILREGHLSFVKGVLAACYFLSEAYTGIENVLGNLRAGSLPNLRNIKGLTDSE